LVFHGLDGTLTEYLRSEFYGINLTKIPRWDRLHIRPDVIALQEVTNDRLRWLWIVAECKVGKVSVRDLRQALNYANLTRAYQAYLVFSGKLSKEVEANLENLGHTFVGTSKWGRDVERKLQIIEAEGPRFVAHLK